MGNVCCEESAPIALEFGRRLDLSSKHLEIVPDDVGRDPSVTSLDLSFNELTTLPARLTRLNSLRNLLLRANHFSKFPENLYKLPLAELFLDDNMITAIPAGVRKFQYLTQLRLGNNQLRQIAPEIGALQELKILDLSINNLKSLPPQIGQLTALQTLLLPGNLLSFLPLELAGCCSLQKLNLHRNNFTEFPAAVGALSQLKLLNLTRNEIVEVPGDVLGRMVALVELRLANNLITALPSEIGNLTQLTQLHITQNALSTLPSEFGRLASLTVCDMSDNKLSSLPVDCLSGCTALGSLNWFGNKLPSVGIDWSACTKLHEIDMSFNPLSELPTTLLKLPSLHRLYAFSCAITRIQDFGDVSGFNAMKITELYMGNNPFGALHTKIGAMAGVKILSVFGCGLSSLPASLYMATSLVKLRLAGNNLTTLPGLELLVNLDELVLSDNPFQLSAFKALRALTKLIHLEMCNCGLPVLPDEVLQLQGLRHLDIALNNITQLPPDLFFQLSRLEFFDASHNRATYLPSRSLQTSRHLKEIKVTNNCIRQLPEEVSRLRWLTTLAVDGNPLTSLPPNFALLQDVIQLIVDETWAKQLDTLKNVSFMQASQRYDMGHAETFGSRDDMEDGVVCHGALGGRKDLDYMAIFDGHAGVAAMQICVTTMHVVLRDMFLSNQQPSPRQALADAFGSVADKVLHSNATSGCTAVVAIVVGNKLYVANAGDSRAVLYGNGVATRLSIDHRAGDPVEAKRIRNAGGFVSADDRVCGVLAVARAIGDTSLLPYVTSEPYINEVEITDQHEFLLLGCDGVFDVLDDQTACNYAVLGSTAADSARRVRDAAVLHKSPDNVSVAVLRFRPAASGTPVLVAAPAPDLL
eukprot:TRINITY_DN12736_c0_g1_i1.p1 TRINITY_DN12736_c0_g1~~TRINITY_DN12736_c0_g1_i1.p1  ORF type:complete len:867 (-),score=181.13 TRINITY_DN12736_c0_g1_i1:75-2675(-)